MRFRALLSTHDLLQRCVSGLLQVKLLSTLVQVDPTGNNILGVCFSLLFPCARASFKCLTCCQLLRFVGFVLVILCVQVGVILTPTVCRGPRRLETSAHTDAIAICIAYMHGTTLNVLFCGVGTIFVWFGEIQVFSKDGQLVFQNGLFIIS
jgi:hypothetical protein